MQQSHLKERRMKNHITHSKYWLSNLHAYLKRVSCRSDKITKTFFSVQVQLRSEVLCTPSSTQLGFKLMTSRSWQYISCHGDAYSNHSAISDFLKKEMYSHIILRGLRWFQMHWLSDGLMHWQLIFLVQVWLRTVLDISTTHPKFNLSNFKLG